MAKRQSRSNDEITSPDITDMGTFAHVSSRYSRWFREGEGALADLLDIALSPNGLTIAGAGIAVDKLEGLPRRSICLIHTATKQIDVIWRGGHTPRKPAWSPDGQALLFISDDEAPGDFQLRLVAFPSRDSVSVRLEGRWIEAAQWSPDGSHILLVAAGRHAELSSVQGGTLAPSLEPTRTPRWAPKIEADVSPVEARSLWIYSIENREFRQISPAGTTVWEASWCGNDAAVFVASDGAEEECWYEAELRKINLLTGRTDTIYQPRDQLGCLSSSTSGNHIAVVEAVCSDRGIVAGQLLISSNGLPFEALDTDDLDVTYTAWQADEAIYYAGHRSFETVLYRRNINKSEAAVLWSSDIKTLGGFLYPSVSVIEGDRIAMMIEGFFERPELVLMQPNLTSSLLRFGDDDLVSQIETSGKARHIRWKSTDGIEIQGWLLEPIGSRPFPMIMDIHGGPIWLWRPRFLGRPSLPALLLEEGYALFLPNARGSTGRGQDFARKIFGDVGGTDADDYLTGIDHLTAAGVADTKRLGVTGGSYGGYMTAWLVAKDHRFAAAASLSPITNWVSQHLTSHLGRFCATFLDDEMDDMAGKYFTRSPVMFARRVMTPILLTCGSSDINTPSGQALEFHRALRMHGRSSILLTYPNEGHGVRRMPASIDLSARLIAWFRLQMPTDIDQSKLNAVSISI